MVCRLKVMFPKFSSSSVSEFIRHIRIMTFLVSKSLMLIDFLGDKSPCTKDVLDDSESVLTFNGR